MRLVLVVASCSLVTLACGGSQPPAPQPVASAAPPATTAQPAEGAPTPPPTEGQAHKLLVAANGCWFGGVWAEAERDPPDSRRAAIEARCRDVLRAVYNNDDKAKLEQLRAYEAGVVADLATKVDALAAGDPKDSARREALAKLVTATAAAQREAALARRSADRVKRDVDKEPEKLTKDEVDALGSVSTTKDLDALLALDDPDAKALGYITAMDRIALSRGLPKHLKVYALSGTLKTLFGIAPPEMPKDVATKLPKGAYLAYVTDAAKAAGHPVPDVAKSVREREGLAWAGVLEGVADRIKTTSDKLPAESDLREVSGRIANRLTAWYEAEKSQAGTRPEDKPKPGPKK